MGDVIVKAIAFVLIPLYTRFLTPEAYGVYSLVLTFQAILIIVLGLGFNSAIFKVYNEVEDEGEKKRVVSTALLTLLFWGLPLTILLFMSVPFLSHLIWSSTETALYLKILFVAIFFDIFRLMALAFLRAREKPILYSAINIINFLVLVSLNIINVAIRKRGILGIMESQLITSMLLSIGVGFMVFRRIGFGFSRKYLRGLLDFGLPLIPGGMAAWSLTMTAYYFIHHYCTGHEVGLYGIGLRFGMILNMLIVHPFRTAWLPFVFSIKDDQHANRVYSLALTYFCLVGFTMLLFLSILGKEIVLITATEAFLGGYRIIPFIALAYLFYGLYNTVDIGVLLTGKTKVYAFITLLTALLQIGLNFLLVPLWGIMGAALVMAFSYMVLFLIMFFTAQKLYPIRYEIGRLVKMSIIGIGIFIISLFIQSGSIWLSILIKICLITIFPVLLWIFKFFHPQEISAIKDFIKRKI